MANPQKENGYTPIANELLEGIIQSKFNATQLKIILFIMRYTFGFSRKEGEISLTYISKGTGISKRYINSELKRLIDWNVVIVVKEHTDTSSRVIGINKNYDAWNIGIINQQVNNSSTGEQYINTTVEEQFNTPVEEFFTQDKQDIKQDIKQKKPAPKIYYPLDDSLNSTVIEFIDFRKKIKSPMTEHAIELLMKKLDKLTVDNDEKIEILNQSIMNGWKGIFPLKQDNGSSLKQTQDDFAKTMEGWLNESTRICDHSNNY